MKSLSDHLKCQLWPVITNGLLSCNTELWQVSLCQLDVQTDKAALISHLLPLVVQLSAQLPAEAINRPR